MISYSPFAKRRSMVSWAFLREVVSRSMRSTRAAGNIFSNSSSTRWVPKPVYFSLPPQAGHTSGTGLTDLPQ